MKHTIYVVRRTDGLVKIGTTINLEFRLRALATAHGPLEVLKLLNGGRAREHKLHHAYRAHREFGEWFRSDVVPLIRDEPEGDVVVQRKDETRAEFEAQERAMADEASAKANEALKHLKARTGLTKDDAIAAICSGYGLPENFFRHVVKGRAMSINAYGYKIIREIYLSEMRALLNHVEREMAEMDGAAVNQGGEVR